MKKKYFEIFDLGVWQNVRFLRKGDFGLLENLPLAHFYQETFFPACIIGLRWRELITAVR